MQQAPVKHLRVRISVSRENLGWFVEWSIPVRRLTPHSEGEVKCTRKTFRMGVQVNRQPILLLLRVLYS